MGVIHWWTLDGIYLVLCVAVGVWLHRWRYLPGIFFAALLRWIGGWTVLAFYYFGALAVLLHLTSSVKHVCHRFGRRRFPTRDCSRNSAIVALWSFGEGWHNNHHHFPGSARAGFFWWEIDVFYWLINALAWSKLIWDVRGVPAALISGGWMVRRL